VRKLVYQTVQNLFVGASQQITLRTPWFLQPLQGYQGALRGTAFEAQKVIQPEVVFHVEDLAGIVNLPLWQTTVETTYRGVLGDSEFYTATSDVSAEFILQGGNFVVEISGHALSRAGFIVTNRDTAGRTLLVRTEVWGRIWPFDPRNAGVPST